MRRFRFKFLVFIYALALVLAFAAAIVTAYALAHPELRAYERNPFVRQLIADYGLTTGLLLALLSAAASILFFWPFFLLYIFGRKRYQELASADPLFYSLMSAFGFSQVTIWLLDATNDISYLLFQQSPIAIGAVLELWNLFVIIETAFLMTLFWTLDYLRRRRRKLAVQESAQESRKSSE